MHWHLEALARNRSRAGRVEQRRPITGAPPGETSPRRPQPTPDELALLAAGLTLRN